MAEKRDFAIQSVPLTTPPLTNSGQRKDGGGDTEKMSKIPPKIKAWFLLFLHGVICIALSLSVVLGVNGYEALDPSVPRKAHKGLIFRVSDITTLISAALVIVKLLVSSWSTLMVWACGHFLLDKRNGGSSPTQVSFMMRWKFPPWLLDPLKLSATSHNWVISLGLLLVLVQAFINPILSGSVNWKSSVVASSNTRSMASVDPTADFSLWFWYISEGAIDARIYLRQAAGYAGLAWADSSTTSANGSSMTGNGCRGVINDNSLTINSTLMGVVIPCINIHSISWYRSASDISEAQSNLTIKSDPLSVVGDAPLFYSRPGVAAIFDSKLLYNSSQNTKIPPAPTVWLGNGPNGIKTISLMVARQSTTKPTCTGLHRSNFGDVEALSYHLLGGKDTGDQACFLIGTINFTAGVTTSKESKYISHRVVEDQTPLDRVLFEPNAWVQEAIWLLPDLMTIISLMNSSQLPTYNNVDGYVKLLVSQAYLSAWTMLHNSFEMTGPEYTATSVEPRLKAEVSSIRVYIWLAICLLMPASGVLLLTLVLSSDDLVMDRELNRENKEAAKESLIALGKEEASNVGGELIHALLPN